MTNALLINGALGLLPVVVFLAVLVQSDTFRLVRLRYVVALIISGAGAALIALIVGKAMLLELGIAKSVFVLFGGPLIEEALKALIVIYLVRANRIGFALDAVIAGFAIGAGFSLLENYIYLTEIGQGHAAIWIVRGFGTAVMHGGATAMFAVFAQLLTPKNSKGSPLRFLPGFVAALALHMVFNQFLSHPVLLTMAMLIGVAAGLSVIQHRGHKSIDNWLDVDFGGYRSLLEQIKSGAFRENEFGRILDSLRARLDPAEIDEIILYIQLHAELVLFGEEILRARGRGEVIDITDQIKAKLAQFHYLEERIGRAIRMTLQRHLDFSRYQIFQLYKLERDAGQLVRKAHLYNTDLLLDEADRDSAKQEFPNVAFALNNPELRDIFAVIDARANITKTNSRRWGLAAIFLATLAVMIAAGNVFYDRAATYQIMVISGIGGGALIAGVIIGALSIAFSKRKTRWLADRLASERIRQFHFQYYVTNAGEILAGAEDEALAGAFCAKRVNAVAEFSERFLGHVEEHLVKITQNESDMAEGLHGEASPIASETDPALLDQYFGAYSRLRFERQLNYCNHVLRESRSISKPSAARQAQLLGATTMTGFLGIIAIYEFTLIGIAANAESITDDAMHVVAMWAAILALAARIIEDGFQPKREIERMAQYRIALRRIHERFRAAQSPDLKIEAMQDLERLSYQEMSLFLKSKYEARFIL